MPQASKPTRNGKNGRNGKDTLSSIITQAHAQASGQAGRQAGGTVIQKPHEDNTIADSIDDSVADSSNLLRVAAYCRYSSHMQDTGFSLAAQHEAIDREAAALGTWQLHYYDEPSTSAFTDDLDKRPIFLRMLEDARDHKLDAIVVHRLDRFSRKLSITARVVPALVATDVQFVSLQERLNVATAADTFQLHILGSVAEFESAHKGAQIKNGKVQRAKRGLHTCRVPYGYREQGEKLPAVPDTPPDTPPDDALDNSDPAYTWNGLQRFFALALSGMPDYTIADHLNNEGYRLVTPSKARREDGSADTDRLFSRVSVSYLRRNVYYRPFTPTDTHGTIKHAGVEYRGQHVAALDWDTWQQVQEIASNRRWGWNTPGIHQSHTSAIPFTAEFRGLAVCAACGHRLYLWRTAYETKGEAHRRVYERYVCNANKRHVVCSHDRQWARIEDVRALWIDWIREHLTLPNDWQSLVKEHIEESVNNRSGASQQGTPRQIQRERTQWVEKRERAVELYADGLKDREWMQARVAEADAALLALDRSLRPKEVQRVRLIDAGRFLTELADDWQVFSTEQRILTAAHIIAPGGLHLDVHGTQGQVNRWHPAESEETPRSCTIVRVDLQPAFRDLLATLEQGTSVVA